LSLWQSVQELGVLSANASPGAKTRRCTPTIELLRKFACARCLSRQEDLIGIDTSALTWVFEARGGGGGGEKRLRIYTSSRLLSKGFCSPSCHRQRGRLRLTKRNKTTQQTEQNSAKTFRTRPKPSEPQHNTITYSNKPNRH
jgi:hypothetical protein